MHAVACAGAGPAREVCSAGIFGCEHEAAVLAVCNMLRDACCARMQGARMQGAAHNRHNMQQTTSHMRCATGSMQQKDSIPQATCTIRQTTCKMQSAAQYIVQHSTLCDVRHTTITMLWQLLPPPHLHWIPFIMCPTTTRTHSLTHSRKVPLRISSHTRALEESLVAVNRSIGPTMGAVQRGRTP